MWTLFFLVFDISVQNQVLIFCLCFCKKTARTNVISGNWRGELKKKKKKEKPYWKYFQSSRCCCPKPSGVFPKDAICIFLGNFDAELNITVIMAATSVGQWLIGNQRSIHSERRWSWNPENKRWQFWKAGAFQNKRQKINKHKSQEGSRFSVFRSWNWSMLGIFAQKKRQKND